MYIQVHVFTKMGPEGAISESTTYINLNDSLEVKKIRTFQSSKTYANEVILVHFSTYPGNIFKLTNQALR